MISVTSEYGDTYSSISNLFIDHYMKDANGEFVKIYLYIIRLLEAERSIDIQQIADQFECTQKDVCRGLRYWVDKGLLRLEFNQNNELYGITVMQVPPPKHTSEPEKNSGLDLLHRSAVSQGAKDEDPIRINDSRSSGATIYNFPSREAVPAESGVEVPIPEKQTYSMAQIRTLPKDKDWEDVTYLFGTLWGHDPNREEANTLHYILDQLEFPANLTEYLIEYCANVEHTSHRYMEKIAINWYQRDIRTKEKAVKETSEHNNLIRAITRELALQRILSPTELKYVNTWKNEYHFRQEIIIEACQVACQKNQIKFSYINGILKKWHEKGVTTVEDIQRLERSGEGREKTTAKKTAAATTAPNLSFAQRRYDDNELDALFINEINQNAAEN